MRDKPTPKTRIDWPSVVDLAATIAASYSTPVTLRQLFYRLVAVGKLPNVDTSYKTLSARTAAARRDGWFPALLDQGRTIEIARSWPSASAMLAEQVDRFRLDHAGGQPYTIVIGVEKATMAEQLWSWFADYGVPIVALRGYSSETLERRVIRHVESQDRPAVLLYAGDHDPTGEDIDRNFIHQTDCWDEVVRVALSGEQVDRYALPAMPGKASDSRADGFIAKHGRLVQVELEALDPDTLRELYEDAFNDFWDTSAYDTVVAEEEEQRGVLEAAIGQLGGDDDA